MILKGNKLGKCELISDSTGKGVAALVDDGEAFLNAQKNQSWLSYFTPHFKIIEVTMEQYHNWKYHDVPIDGWH